MNPIGFSTGALALGDFHKALELLEGKPCSALEISALRLRELRPLVEAAPSLHLSQFDYVALHVPSQFGVEEEPEVIELLKQAPPDWNLILHPDTIHDRYRWACFGRKLALENTDRRKSDGRTADELSHWFEILPDASFCLDLAHAQQWDTTLTEAYLLLKRFANRLCQIHISQLDSASHHHSLSISSIRAFSELMWLIPEQVPFIIESRVSSAGIDAEVKAVEEIARSGAAQVHAISA